MVNNSIIKDVQEKTIKNLVDKRKKGVDINYIE